MAPQRTLKRRPDTTARSMPRRARPSATPVKFLDSSPDAGLARRRLWRASHPGLPPRKGPQILRRGQCVDFCDTDGCVLGKSLLKTIPFASGTAYAREVSAMDFLTGQPTRFCSPARSPVNQPSLAHHQPKGKS